MRVGNLTFLVLLGIAVLDGQAKPLQERQGQNDKRLDQYGDPLPQGATARLGTLRLRHCLGSVRCLAFDPDGVLLASVSGGCRTVRLWDVATGQEVRSFGQSVYSIDSLAYAPDGKIIATGSYDGIYLWEVRSGKKLRLLRVADQKDHVTMYFWSIAFSPDGKLLASASGDGFVRLWDPASGNILKVWRASKEWATHVAFSPDSKLLVSCDKGGSTRLWDVATAREVRKLDSAHTFVVFSPNGKVLGTCDTRRGASVYDVATGKELESHYQGPMTVAFSSDNKLTFSVNSKGVWERPKGQEDWVYNGDVFIENGWHWINCAAVSPDRKLIAFGGSYGRIGFWDLAKKETRKRTPGHDQSVNAVAFSPDGKYLVSGSDDGTLRRWDARTGKEQPLVHGPDYGIYAVAYSPDGKFLAFTDRWVARVLNAATGKEVRRFKTEGDWALGLDFSRDGRSLSATGRSSLRQWNLATGKELKKTAIGNYPCLAQSPDGKLAAYPAETWGSAPRLRELDSGKEWRCFPDRSKGKKDQRYSICAMAFSPDSKLVVAGSSDGWMSVMKVATGKEAWSAHGIYAVKAIAFSPDGKLLAASGGWNVHVWEADTGKSLATLRGHRNQVRSLAFSPDGKMLASGSEDTTVLLWPVERQP